MRYLGGIFVTSSLRYHRGRPLQQKSAVGCSFTVKSFDATLEKKKEKIKVASLCDMTFCAHLIFTRIEFLPRLRRCSRRGQARITWRSNTIFQRISLCLSSPVYHRGTRSTLVSDVRVYIASVSMTTGVCTGVSVRDCLEDGRYPCLSTSIQ